MFSSVIPLDAAHAADAIVKIVRPIEKTRRRPRRSDSARFALARSGPRSYRGGVLGLSRRRPAPPSAPVAPAPGEVAAILLLAQEGLYFQDEVEDVLVEIRDGGDLGELSRLGGP